MVSRPHRSPHRCLSTVVIPAVAGVRRRKEVSLRLVEATALRLSNASVHPTG
jgi:hypothetical protein